MNGDEDSERRHEAAGWLVIAREDVRVAQACLMLDPPALGVAAYHCQQAAEKLAKGLLVAPQYRSERRMISTNSLTSRSRAIRNAGTCWMRSVR
jgi:HEPN domain-containing protein